MNGVQVDTWIRLESCDISYSIVDGMAEMQFGGLLDGLSVTATEKALINLRDKATEALEAIKAAEH
nr:hypothetical protein [Kibdelosporangium sp. MJ126-NF4]CEL21427.1 hypothetical protein [Kibdelosporangium sp. MJ126-NF4]CTQ96006.1 hypothetical protein [Kibdelosporangium sp. MJ126-NF4]